MHSPPKLMLILLLAIALSVPASAVILKPGTYRLKWVVTKEDRESCVPTFVNLNPVAEQGTKLLHGVVSPHAFAGAYGPLTLVVDESKGAGKGYDVIYLIPETRDGVPIDLKNAPRMKLTRSNSNQWKGDMKTLTKNPLIGGSSTVKLKDAVTSVVLGSSKYENGADCYDADLGLAGGWKGAIKSDIGDLNVSTSPGLCSRYDVPIHEEPGAPVSQVGGAVFIDSPQRMMEKVLLPAKACQFGGKLYSVSVAPAGNEVKIQPYMGAVGTVRVSGIDGYGRPARASGLAIEGLPGMFVNMKYGTELTVPAGSYENVSTEVPYGDGQTPDGHVAVGITRKGLEVVSSRTVELALGGPIKMELTATHRKSDDVKMKSGESQWFVVVLSVDDNTGAQASPEIAVVVKDASGKVLLSDKTKYEEDYGGHYYVLKIPDSWHPGTYSIEGTLDIRPYQDIIKASRTFVVVK